MRRNYPMPAQRPSKAAVVCCVGVAAVLVLAVLVLEVSQAAHPLITEDTGTQGHSNLQFELTAERSDDTADGTNKQAVQSNAVLAYGARDNLDLLFTLPHKRERSETDGSIDVVSGWGDAGLDLKWRFYERGSLSFALKPGVTLPTGDEARGLGTGRAAYSLFLVTSFDLSPWAFHIQLGHYENRNVNDEQVDLQHFSLAATREYGQLKVVADLGTITNTDKTSNNNPAFSIVGLIYAVNKSLELDIGYMKGVSYTEADHSLMGGATFRF
ncbi:MAG: transporter [Sulfuricaulis sp.]|uniref:transporter n=1 Tax=Sulfuricaulis sp. TaxID=2003553 RepID=UPI0025E41F82|nr:transporter [Sulfuricaulis sp.]MCR4347362.1 transporter [Sulfuricaulis sp.]